MTAYGAPPFSPHAGVIAPFRPGFGCRRPRGRPWRGSPRCPAPGLSRRPARRRGDARGCGASAFRIGRLQPGPAAGPVGGALRRIRHRPGPSAPDVQMHDGRVFRDFFELLFFAPARYVAMRVHHDHPAADHLRKFYRHLCCPGSRHFAHSPAFVFFAGRELAYRQCRNRVGREPFRSLVATIASNAHHVDGVRGRRNVAERNATVIRPDPRRTDFPVLLV